MELSKNEQYELEIAVHHNRGDLGIIKLRQLLILRREYLNARWFNISDVDELRIMQGEAKAIASQLKLLDKGPTIKPEAIQ